MMKRALYILFIIVLPAVCFGKDGMQALFKKGNASYNKGQFKEALATYKNIADAGYESSALYFNMGNACYKTGDIPSALLYYEKAHKLAPGDDDISFNIKFVNLRTTDKIDQAPEFFITKWWRSFILAASSDLLGWISVLLVLAASGILILYFFTSSIAVKKVSFYVALTLFITGAFVIFIAGMQTSYFNDHREGIIFSNSVTVKSGPVEKSGDLFVIHEGTKAAILDASDGWLKIKLANGSEGWVKATDLKEI
ncbi:MAG TPA: tetratricopeptide repeat protein [Mucilaginibacter sp.]|nr:tetratricopeptide repeat protein [Mucilaginibacter sp.]